MLTLIRKVLALFEARERWQILGLLAAMVVMALVQTVGVASIMPFMSLVADPEVVTSNPWMRWAYAHFGFESTRSFIFFVGLLVLFVIAFSNTVTGLTTWLMLRFAWNKHYSLSRRLLIKYLYQPYSFFLTRNTAVLAKNILGEVHEVINGVLMPLMRMLSKSFVAAFILLLLLMVDATLALTSLVVLGSAYGLIYTKVRQRQARLGKQRVAANGLRFRAAGEAFGGIKEIKVLGREEEFIRRFSAPARRFSRVNTANSVISEIPRYALETVAFGGILVIVLYLLSTRDDLGETLAVITLYAFAAYRLMPALQGIFSGLTKIRFHRAALDELYEDLLSPNPEDASGGVSAANAAGDGALVLQSEIAINGISFHYAGGVQPVLRSVSLDIPKNGMVGFVGGTGSGKTTLVDIILGLLRPQQGSITVDGVPLTAANIGSWRRSVGYVPQHIFLCDASIRRNIALGVSNEAIDDAAVEHAARVAHLHEFVVQLPEGYETVVGERGVRLSGGQRQRIGIARALYHNPDVLIMDEATSALDGITEDRVMQAINNLAHQKTIILVAHRLSTVRECDRIYLFKHGELAAQGTYEELERTNREFQGMAKLISSEELAVDSVNIPV